MCGDGGRGASSNAVLDRLGVLRFGLGPFHPPETYTS